MKKTIILFFTIFCLSAIQAQNDIVGNWKGTADVMGQKLNSVFHFTKNNESYNATFDSPDQHAFGLECGKVFFANDSLFVDIKAIKGSYVGKMKANEIVGYIQQGTYKFTLTLQKTLAEDVAKPQTPKPPFAYISEDVEYENKTQQVHLGGTLTKPSGNGKFAAVILITGSGQQDRDESIGLHKPFLVIADYLTKQGIAVLRVDDRGRGKSTGNFAQSSSADFATDVMAAIDFLKARNDIDINHIGLLGHSEGGVIAPYVAARSKDVNFVVSLAGPAIGGKATNDYQNILPLQNQGIAKEYIDSFLSLHHVLVNDAITMNADSSFKQAIKKTFLDWKERQFPETTNTLFKGTDEQVIKSLQKNYGDFRNPWWRFLLTYEPATDIEKLSCPILAVNGSKDEQVESTSNLAAFEKALKKSKSKNYKTIDLPGLNHLFQHCKTCNLEEYFTLDETIDPATLNIIANWIKDVTK